MLDEQGNKVAARERRATQICGQAKYFGATDSVANATILGVLQEKFKLMAITEPENDHSVIVI